MLSIIVAPATAPQIPKISEPKPRSAILTSTDKRIVDGIREHGAVQLWAFLEELAIADGVAGRADLRDYRTRLYARVARLIRAGDLVWAGRNCVAVPSLNQSIPSHKRQPTVGIKPPKRPGSAHHHLQQPPAAVPNNSPVSQPVTAKNRISVEPVEQQKTESAPSPEQARNAATALSRLPRKQPKRWTGWIHGQRCWRGRLVQTPYGDVLPLLLAFRGKILLQDTGNEPIPLIPFLEHILWTADEVKLVKNPNAVALGQRKLGVREKWSELKSQTARANGSRPCRPGRRRGRPPRSNGLSTR